MNKLCNWIGEYKVIASFLRINLRKSYPSWKFFLNPSLLLLEDSAIHHASFNSFMIKISNDATIIKFCFLRLCKDNGKRLDFEEDDFV